MTGLQRERYFPFLFGAICAVPTGIAIYVFGMEPLPKTVPIAMTTFGFVVSGFVATQRNMLLAMGGTNTLKLASSTGYHQDITDYMKQCIYTGLVATLIALTGIFIGNNTTIWIIWTTVIVFTTSLIVGLVFRNERIMATMVKKFLEEQKQTGKK